MKKTLLIISLILCFASHGQKYSFIPDSLMLLPMRELVKKEPPADFEPVYYEDGTKASFKDVLPLIMNRKLIPQMFVDENGEYKALVVKSTLKNEDIRIVFADIPKSLEKHGYSFGNPDSDTVIINIDGGPENDLNTYVFEYIFSVLGKIDENNYFLINMRESQTLHPEETEKEEISWEEAKNYNEKTVKTLYDLISYFKSLNKKVYVVGGSYGSLVGLKSLVDYNNIADGYLLMCGRLDMTKEISTAYSKGYEAKFEEDATTPIIGEKSDNVYTVNMRKIAAAINRDEKYTELLKDSDLSNLTYYYSEIDQSVGKLTEKEIAFLKSKNAKVVSVKIEHRKYFNLLLKEGLEILLDD
ncbi:hypothetical protein H8K90_13105 [Winogradskyella echinorum]|uniref:Alpha/beta hydrolase family protein n=1 Tax=Winogradskyella echinorum TaxID=538189 RepID=A0ABR6Y3K4_9FLAO|nr:hypothetical protein [Winogradskyella echinorum]MBC3847329.1 hypothetical protein [Winogradskyella echinorum]MBC5751677.1 hypothetical protein [Winogradskyella echinorum]